MKTIPSILSFLLLLNPLAAQQTRQLADPAVPGATTRPNANTGGASAGGGFVAGGQASAAATTGTSTRPSATTGGLGMPGVPGAGGGGFGTGTVVPGSLPASDEFAAGLLSEEAEQDLTSAAAAYRRTIQTFDRQRTEAANAIFRLGEVYRKMGRLEEAKVQYARILREFPDMVRLTELSHGLLLGEEGRPGVGRGPEVPTVATDPAADTRTGPDRVSLVMRERYGLATGPSMDPALAARYGITVPSPSPAPTAGRESERLACVSNLKQLGLAARIHAAEKDAVYPPSPALMSNEIAMTKVLVCPSDATRQPAPSWAEFDPYVHMTYEYLGAGVRESEPQRTLYRCPIHGHVALADGSVQQGRPPWPGPTVQVQQQRVERFGEEAAQRPAAILNTILNGLRQIDGAKDQWALENRQPAGTQPTEQDVARYILGGLPVPIAGERYEIKPVGESPVAVLTRPIGNRKAGDQLTIEPAGVATEAARIPAVVYIPVLVSSNGTIQLEGKPVEMDMLRAQLHERAANPGQLTMVTVQADQDADFIRVAEVLEAGRSAGITNVTVAADLQPMIHQEIERLTAEAKVLESEDSGLGSRSRPFTNPERVRLEVMIAEARTQQEQARQRLQALSFPAEHLPAIVSQDPRYQRLKAEYETAVLDGDETAQETARTRLQDWVEKIYRPELESEVLLADYQQDQRKHKLDELDALRALRSEQDRQAASLRAQVGQLQRLLEQAALRPSP